MLFRKIMELREQLPDGMKCCTLRLVECPRGHGRLTADNWIDHGCDSCRIEELEGVMQRIAWEVIGDAEDSYRTVYNAVVRMAQEALAK